jgi:hypothetical protein
LAASPFPAVANRAAKGRAITDTGKRNADAVLLLAPMPTYRNVSASAVPEAHHALMVEVNPRLLFRQ